MRAKPRLAAVGTGYFSQFQYEAWTRLEVDLQAVCSRTQDHAIATARRYGIPHVFTDFEDMLDQVQPDLVDIITPPVTHLDYIRAAASRGIAMICQKPFTNTLAEAREAVEIAGRAGVPLIVHENFRFQPWHMKLRELLDDAVIGTPYQISFRMRPGDGQGPDAYLNRQPYFQNMERFLVHETAIHLIDVFRYLMGEVTDVTAELRRLNPVIAGEDAGYIWFSFANGARGLFDGNRLSDHKAENRRLTIGEMLLEGSDGVLRLDGDGGLYFRPHGDNHERPVPYAWNKSGFGGDSVYRTQQHALQAIQQGAPVMNAAHDYLRNLEIEEAVYRSSAEGRRITLGK